MSQPTAAVLIGINDVVAPAGYGFIPFTASGGTTGATATVTSATNLTGTGTYLAGRLHGNGIHVGDWIEGTNIRGAAQVSAISWSGSVTTITINNGGQVTGTPTGNYNVIMGNADSSGWAGQGQIAAANSLMGSAIRYLAGAIVPSWDSSGQLTFSTSPAWSTVNQVSGNTGPTIKTASATGAWVQYQFPAWHSGGMVRFAFVGTSDFDASGCYVTASGTSAAGVLGGNTTIARAGWAGLAAPVVISIKTTAADAGLTIRYTFNAGSGGSPLVQFDHLSFDAQRQSPIIFITQPPGLPQYNSTADPLTNIPALNSAMTQVVTNLQTAPSGGFPSIGRVTPTYTNCVVADYFTAIQKRSFWLGTSLTSSGSTASSVTIYGQRTTAQGDQEPPVPGQQMSIPSANIGDLGEIVFLTSVTAISNVTIGANTYPAWVVNLNRNLNPSGTLATFEQAATGSTTTLTGTAQLWDVMWMGPDYVHPGDAGSTEIASLALQSYLTAPGTSNPDNVAASAGRWVQGRNSPYPRPLDNGIWTPRGTVTTFAPAASTVYAMRYFVPEDTLTIGIGLSVVTGATGAAAWFAILEDVSYGSYPGAAISDFGLTSLAIGTTTGNLGLGTGGGVEVKVAQGHYWVCIGFGTVPPASVRGLEFRTDEANIDATALSAIPNNNQYGIVGYTWTPSLSGANITNMNVSGTPAPIYGGAAAVMPRPWVQRRVAKYNYAG